MFIKYFLSLLKKSEASGYNEQEWRSRLNWGAERVVQPKVPLENVLKRQCYLGMDCDVENPDLAHSADTFEEGGGIIN